MKNVFLISFEGLGSAIVSNHVRVVNDESSWASLGAKVGVSSEEARKFSIDKNGHPYWLLEVVASAPPRVRRWALDKVRVARMEL